MKIRNERVHFYLYPKAELMQHIADVLASLDEWIDVLQVVAPEILAAQLVSTFPMLPRELAYQINIFNGENAWPILKKRISETALSFGMNDWDSQKKDRRGILPDIRLDVNLKERYGSIDEQRNSYFALSISEGLFRRFREGDLLAWFERLCEKTDAHFAFIYGSGSPFGNVVDTPLFRLSAISKADMYRYRNNFFPGCFWRQFLSGEFIEKMKLDVIAAHSNAIEYSMKKGKETEGLWIQLMEDVFSKDMSKKLLLREGMESIFPPISLASYAFDKMYNFSRKAMFFPLRKDEEVIVNELMKLPKSKLLELSRRHAMPSGK